jgi:hypothetical protein
VIETEESRGGIGVFEVALGAVETVGKGARMEDGGWRMDFPNFQFAFAEMVGLLAGFDESGTGGGREFEAILNDG